MASILIVYSTTDGHTRRICERLSAVIEEAGHQTSLRDIATGPEPDPARFDRVLIGASIRYGKHSPRIVDFINRHQEALDARPNAFFSVNLVARKPGKDEPYTNPYMRLFLKRIQWRPKELAVFAGRLDYPRYGWLDRNMIRLIMWMTKGPTDPGTVAEFTDWDRVEAFGRRWAAADS
jgi:menaquinone-dependent protoporphyrinogen oxidase